MAVRIVTVGDREFLGIAGGLASASPEVREQASERICDWLRSFDRKEVRALAILLSSAVVVEGDADCRESELNALGGLTETGFLEAEDISALRQLERNTLRGSELEHFDYLASEYFRP